MRKSIRIPPIQQPSVKSFIFVWLLSKKYNKYPVLFSIACMACMANAQVVFSKKPQSLELIPRSISTNLGTVQIKGEVLNNKYQKMRVLMFQSGVKKIDVVQSLPNNPGTNPFTYNTQIKAGKYRYDFEISFYGSDTFKYKADNVVCGDVFVIQGQSNAVANAYSGLANPTYNDSFIRSFGTSSYDYTSCFNDTAWHLADGDGYYAPGCIGQWGMVLAKYVLDSFNMPVAILNGAVGGTSVVYHQKYQPQPDNLYTIYGRLLYRIKKAGLQNNIRSLFYFQGESDGPYPKLHDSLFRILFNDWTQEYKSIKKYYVVQVRGFGCGDPAGEILEVQRQFEFTLPNCKVVSANGLNGHDGCHYYFKNGYEQLGKILSPLAARDLYGKSGLNNIDPPNIKSAEYINADFTKVALNMMQSDDSVFADPNFHTLFSVSGDSGVTIVSGSIVKNRVVLNLNKGTCKPLKISYTGKPFTQPWVKNKINSALISFNLIPINKPKPGEWYSICKNTAVTLGEDSLEGYQYLWKNTQTNKTYTTAKIKIKPAQSEAYKLLLTNKMSNCKYDSFQINVVVDQTPEIKLGNDTVLCKNEILHFETGNIYQKTEWKLNAKTSNKSSFDADTSGTLTCKVISNVGCTFTDTLILNYSIPEIKISAPAFVCKNTLLTAKVKKGFTLYQWNNNKNYSSDTFFSTYAGLITVKATDAYGCNAFDTAFTNEYPEIKYHLPAVEFCENDSAKITLPFNLLSWKRENVYLPGSFYFNRFSERKITLIDSHNCEYTDSIKAKINSLPRFNLGKDTTLCQNSPVKITCPMFASKYYWNGLVDYKNYVETTTPSLVICKIINSNNCGYADTINILQHPQPALLVPSDTALCEGETLEWISDTLNAYSINGVFYPKAIINLPGNYSLEVKSKNGCTEHKTINVTYRKCTNSYRLSFQQGLKVYPNPVNNFLTIKGIKGKMIEIALYSYSGKIVLQKRLTPINGETRVYTGDLPSGVYYLNLINDTLNPVFIIVKE